MNIRIRSERTSDYNSIANVNYEAFLGWHPGNQYFGAYIGRPSLTQFDV